MKVPAAATIPDWPPMGTNQLSGASEGSRVIVMWARGDGPYEYTVHREGGRVFGQSESDRSDHMLDRTKELTFVDRVWAAKE